MSDFKVKMQQIRFRLGLRPHPAGGAYSAPPDPLAGFEGPTSKGEGEGLKRGEGVGRGGERREREGKREGREREGSPGTCLHPPNMKS